MIIHAFTVDNVRMKTVVTNVYAKSELPERTVSKVRVYRYGSSPTLNDFVN